MEGFITLIIIIVVFNIFNMLLRALKGGKTPAKQRALVTAEQFLQDNISIQKEKSNQPLQGDAFYQAEPDKDIEVSDTSYIEDFPVKDKPIPMFESSLKVPATVKVADKSANQFTSNLQQVLTKRDPLLAAFVFHEILEPPPALRRKR